MRNSLDSKVNNLHKEGLKTREAVKGANKSEVIGFDGHGAETRYIFINLTYKVFLFLNSLTKSLTLGPILFGILASISTFTLSFNNTNASA